MTTFFELPCTSYYWESSTNHYAELLFCLLMNKQLSSHPAGRDIQCLFFSLKHGNFNQHFGQFQTKYPIISNLFMKNEMTWIRERSNEVISKTKGILESIYVFVQHIIFQIYYTKNIFHLKNNYNRICDYKIVTFRE